MVFRRRLASTPSQQGIPQNWRNFHPARLPKFLAFAVLSRRESTVGDAQKKIRAPWHPKKKHNILGPFSWKEAARALLREHKTFILTFVATWTRSFWPRSAGSPVQWAPSCSHTAIKKAKIWPMQGKISYSWGHIAMLWHYPGHSSLVT